MNITEFEEQMRVVVTRLKDPLGRTVSLRKRRLYEEQARKQILRIAKEAQRKLDRSKLGLEGKGYGDFTLCWGPFDRSSLPEKLQRAKDESLAQIQELAAREL